MPHRHGRIPRIVVAAMAVAALTSLATCALVVAALESPPPLPPQPGLPAASCQPATVKPDTWSVVATEHSLHVNEATPRYEVIVDPSMPCRMYRARDAQTIERSTDGGHTWQRIFHDDQTNTSSRCQSERQVNVNPIPPLWQQGEGSLGCGTFAATSMVVPSPDAVAITENSSGVALALSGNAGHSWYQAGDALAGQPAWHLVPAPGHPAVLYAVTQPAGSLYVTTDTGADWVQMPVPAPASLQVDPTDPAHLWGLLAQQIVESHDFGTNWTPIPTAARGLGLYYEHGSIHPHRLFLLDPTQPQSIVTQQLSGQQTAILYSDDDGTTWTDSGLLTDDVGNGQAGTQAAESVVSDPADPERMVYVHLDTYAQRVSVQYTADGFDSVLEDTATPPIDVDAPRVPDSPLAADINWPAAVVQADRFGSFYISVDTYCFHSASQCGPTGTEAHTYWRFRPMDPPARASVPPPRVTPPSGPVPRPSPMAQIKACALPVQSLTGPLAYDGMNGDLLYTVSETGTANYTGVIRRLDPRPALCRDDGEIVVHFRPADLARLAAEFGSDPVHPVIGGLTYDTRHDEIWASLAGTNFGASYLFHLTPARSVTPGVETADATLAFAAGCGMFLSYDMNDDTIWTCAQNSDPNHIRAGDGQIVPTCMSRIDSNPVPGSSGAATWTLVGDRRMAVQEEDDSTIVVYDTTTCTPRETWAHRTFAEPGSEDEQMACDGGSFAPDSGVPPQLQATAIWLRDADASEVSAYIVPDGGCPVRSAVDYAGPTAAMRGDVVQLCATLRRDGIGTALAGLPLDFTLGNAGVGTATTDGSGRACVPELLTLPPGSYDVHVSFAGNSWYLPASTVAALRVRVPVVAPILLPQHPAPPPSAALLPPPPNPPLAGVPNPIPNPAQSLQSQTQTQAQSQGQAQAQSMPQAGVVAEPQAQAEPQLAFAYQEANAQAQAADNFSAVDLSPAHLPWAERGTMLGATATFLAAFAAGLRWAMRGAVAASPQVVRRRRHPRD